MRRKSADEEKAVAGSGESGWRIESVSAVQQPVSAAGDKLSWRRLARRRRRGISAAIGAGGCSRRIAASMAMQRQHLGEKRQL